MPVFFLWKLQEILYAIYNVSMRRKLERKVKIYNNNIEFTLKYYLTQQDEEKCRYGIEIVKVYEDIEEYEAINDISYSKEYILNLINKFANNSVTPITLSEIYNDEIN